MQIRQPLPPALLESVPLPLLHVAHDGRVHHLNPRAVDLLGVSVFDALDSPVESLLGTRPHTGLTPVACGDRQLTAHTTDLPDPYGGRLVTLEEKPATDDAERLWSALAPLNERLTRIAEILPADGSSLVRNEVRAALGDLRALVRHAENDALAAILDGRVDAPMGDCPVDALMRQTFLALAPWIRLAGANVEQTTDGPLGINGNPGLVERLLEEALQNALAHTPRGGTVEISLTGDGARCRIAIGDSGPGIPTERRAELLERDTGGLYICRRVAALHGGTLRLDESTAGGCLLVADLPVSGGTD